MSLAVLEDLKTKTIFAMKTGEVAMQGFDAAFVAFLVAGGAQDDGDLARRMVLVLVLFGKRNI